MDSGVVIRISAGWRAKRARSLAGVSPVRMAMVGSWKAMPAERAACAMPTSGERRLRSISTARALMGEMQRTRQRWWRGGTGTNMRRLMHHRKAARVLPVPVGARIRVDSPRAMAGQPSCWGRVGAGKTASNHARTGGWKRLRGDLEGMGRPRSYEGGSACMAVMKSFRNLAVLDTASAFSIDLNDVTVIFAIIPHRGTSAS